MVFQHQLTRPAHGSGDGLFQQGYAALHHAHPVSSHLHDGAVVVDADELCLLREQHAGGWQLQTGKDLLPQLPKVVG